MASRDLTNAQRRDIARLAVQLECVLFPDDPESDIEIDDRAVAVALRRVGLYIDSIDDLMLSPQPLDPAAVKVLLDHLLIAKTDRMVEMIARCLTMGPKGITGANLALAWEAVSAEDVRWAIANTIATVKPTGINEWVEEALRTTEYGSARDPLCLAIARIGPKDRAAKILEEIFHELPVPAAEGLGLAGGESVLPLLKSERGKQTEKHAIRRFDTAIRRIERRLAKKRSQ